MDKIIYKEFPFTIKEINEDERKVVGIITKEVKDDEGDVVVIEGISLERFEKGGIPLLWSHESHAPPIGKTTFLQKLNEEVIAEFQYATKDENPFADTIYKLTKGGYINSFSISIKPKQEPDSIEFMDNGRFKVNKSILLEVSSVNVPANADATVISRQLTKALDEKVITEDEKDELDLFIKELEIKALDNDKYDKAVDDAFTAYVKDLTDNDRTIKTEHNNTICKDCGCDLTCPVCNQQHKSKDDFAWVLTDLEQPCPTKEDEANEILKSLD